MPELPEVETIKEALNKAIENADITSVTVKNRKFRLPIPDDFEKTVAATSIMRIHRIAKYIILDLSNGYSIIWHLGMSGRVKIVDTYPDTLEKHDHVIIETTKGVVIFYDPRRFGMMISIKTDRLSEHPIFKHTGLDPFDEHLTTNFLADAFKNKKTPIKLALLDQSIINGIGNIYASEALYEARISPLRESRSLTSKEITALIAAIRKTLKKAIEAGGSTLKDYRKPDGSMGYFQNEHCVYGKAGLQCPDCSCKKKSMIKKITQGGRSTFFCERLQK